MTQATRPLENGLADRKLPHFDLGFLGFRDFRKSLGKQGKRSASSHPAYHVLVQLKELRLQLTEDLFFGGPGLWLEHHDGGITNLIIVPDQFNEKIKDRAQSNVAQLESDLGRRLFPCEQNKLHAGKLWVRFSFRITLDRNCLESIEGIRQGDLEEI